MMAQTLAQSIDDAAVIGGHLDAERINSSYDRRFPDRLARPDKSCSNFVANVKEVGLVQTDLLRSQNGLNPCQLRVAIEQFPKL